MIVLRMEAVRVVVTGGGSSGAVHRSRPAISLRAALWAGLLASLAGALVLVVAGAGHSGAVAGQARASRQRLSSLPLALQGPASATLGADERGYAAGAAVGGFAMANPVQRLGARFDSSGAQVTSGAARVKLSLQSVGYGSALRAVGAVAPRARGNRVSYDYGGLSAWYANGPLGLEQGFTVARAPAHALGGALTLALAVGDGVPVSLAPGGRSARFGPAKGPSLRYSGLRATDAHGHVLPSWLEVHQGRLLLRVQARGAAYPLHIDPFIQQGEKLVAGSEETGNGQFGFSLALSADGNTALIGAWYDNHGVGAAWVFSRSGSTWTQQSPKLTGGSEEVGTGDFGISVAISGDGSTALIGAGSDDGEAGAAWVFTRSGSTWTQQGPKLTGGSEEVGNGNFGESVAISGDGSTALIGAWRDDEARGAAWVFTRSGSTWTQQGPKLTGGSEEVGEGVFGCCGVALSSDGDTALIGAQRDDKSRGAAWVFTRSGSTWTQQGPKLTGGSEEVVEGSPEGGIFGRSVALSADGSTALIGAPSDDVFVGAAWVFTRSGSTWTQQGPKLTGGSEAVDQSDFGYVALSGDGDTALIGAWGDDEGRGAAWVFTRSASTWTQQGTKLTGGSEEVGAKVFGRGVALSATGDTALIGASGRKGAVLVFTTTPRPEVTGVTPKLGPTTGATTVTISGSNLAEASAVSFGSVKAASFTVNSPSSITAVSPEEPAGKVDITVRTPTGGLSPRTAKDAYRFAPTVNAVSPNAGPSTGGTSVTVTGTGFGLGTTTTTFKFGSTLATSANCTSSTECTVASPSHAAGKAVVKATVNKVNSLKSAGAQFTYE